MGIFRRKRRGDDVPAEAGPVEQDAQEADVEHPDDDPDASERGEAPEQDAAASFQRDHGPFDADEEVPGPDRLDLGSLRVPAVDGLQLQLEVDEATASVTAVQLLLGGSYAQLQAFAAPRTGELWPQVCAEIAASVEEQGGSAALVDGPIGRELRAHPPAGGPPLRFLGVDGPRWLLRAVLSGPAATDDAAAAPLLDVVTGTVVVRGSQAMAPRELLPLTWAALEEATAMTAEQGSAGGRASLDPFERGPEITEVR